LKIKLEDSSQGTPVTISGISEPVIIQKTSEQVIRLREGEASIMSGMVNKTDITSWSGVPGLSSIPGLKYLFGSKDHTVTEDEIVFVVVPHIVRSQSLEQVNLRTVDTGAGTSIELRHAPAEGTTPNPRPAPASTPARPAASTRPSVGTVPGQSAAAAAPAALVQMKQAAETNGNSAPTNQPSTPGQPATVSFTLTPQSGPLAVGATIRVPVVLNGGTDIAAVPLQIKYDPAKLSLLNVDLGDFLGKDGQPVALVHRDDGLGTIVLSSSRPPGTAGVSGTGVVCVLSFQAKATGDSLLVITHPGAVTSAQQQLPVTGAQISIQVK
jgi:general secretion pathway protein D